jgi:hypothetical protein
MTPISKTSSTVDVTVTETTTYRFHDYPNSKCPAHGDPLCIQCARNAGECGGEPVEGTHPGCSFYGATGMHWDTCPNRIR